MSDRTAAALNILVSLVFAAAILLVSKSVSPENSFKWTGVLIAIWFVPYSLLTTRSSGNALKKEFQCVKKLITRR